MDTNTRLEHGQHGHLNGYELDTEAECTGRGQHRRCIVYGSPDGSSVTVRAEASETTAHLPEPTMAQIRKVALGEQRVHDAGRLVFRSVVRWQRKTWDGRPIETSDYEFDVAKGASR